MFLKSKEEICAKHQKQTVTTPSVIAESFISPSALVKTGLQNCGYCIYFYSINTDGRTNILYEPAPISNITDGVKLPLPNVSTLMVDFSQILLKIW